MKTGVCKLCLTETELCNSHIIPEFAYTRLYVPYKGNDRRLLKLNFEKGAKLERTHYKKGLREYLLCRKCEEKFSCYETYVSGLLKKLFSNQLDDMVDIKVDYTKFKMFELSILWRCGITNISNYHINLGEKHLEKLRQVLNNNSFVNFWQYGCFKLLNFYNNEIVYDLILKTEGKKFNGLRVYGIYFYGIQWTFFVGSENHRLQDKRFEDGFLLQNGGLKIVRLELMNNTFLMKLANEIYG